MINKKRKKTRRKRSEKYSIVPIKDLEQKVENELLPAAFNICSIIEKEGKKEFHSRVKQYVLTKCPLKKCVILNEMPSKCPNSLCWIAEGPTWQEFLTPEINAVYSLLMDTYLEALNIPEDPDKKVTIKESPLSVMNRKLKTKETQELLIELLEKSQILKPRIPVIKDVIWAHNRRKYALSIPCLIIQIEGILHDLSYHFKWQFREKEMYRGESAKVRAIIKKLKHKPFQSALINFYTRKDSLEDAPRNLIMHGRSIDYAQNHKLSTVLFLVLIYLIAFSFIKIKRKVTI
jgi:hypothetical protein